MDSLVLDSAVCHVLLSYYSCSVRMAIDYIYGTQNLARPNKKMSLVYTTQRYMGIIRVLRVRIDSVHLSEPLPYEVEACQGDDSACDEYVGVLRTGSDQESVRALRN